MTTTTITTTTVRENLSELLSMALNDTSARHIADCEVAIPYEGVDENGQPVTLYGYIRWGVKSAKDTKRTQAFNMEKAVAAYEEKAAAGKAKGGKAKPSTPLLETEFAASVFTAMGMIEGAATAQAVAKVLNDNKPEGMEDVSWQKVSAVLKAAEKSGAVTKEMTEDKKAGYVRVL